MARSSSSLTSCGSIDCSSGVNGVNIVVVDREGDVIRSTSNENEGNNQRRNEKLRDDILNTGLPTREYTGDRIAG